MSSIFKRDCPDRNLLLDFLLPIAEFRYQPHFNPLIYFCVIGYLCQNRILHPYMHEIAQSIASRTAPSDHLETP
jgi:hypothetical protein